MCDFTRLVNSVRYGPASAVMKEKEIKKKKHTDWKGKNKVAFIHRQHYCPRRKL
jgi:hypothetical protein